MLFRSEKQFGDTLCFRDLVALLFFATKSRKHKVSQRKGIYNIRFFIS